MSIPLATTTIAILRPDSTADSYEADTGPTVIESGIRAHIGSPSGRGFELGGQQEVIDKKMQCDVCDLQHTDLVKDESTDEFYSVAWVAPRAMLGLDHFQVGLKFVKGATS